MRPLLIAIGSMACFAGIASGAETLREMSSAEQVINGREAAICATVATIENPDVTALTYAVAGRVRCDGVIGTGRLEMWSEFPDGGAYSSRALAPSGPLKSLSGTQEWREFMLPFYLKDGQPKPIKLTVNVVLPGPGTVSVGAMRLVQFAPMELPQALVAGASVAPGWWTERTSGWIGGAIGVLWGTAGALIGLFAGRGRAKRLVIALMCVMAITAVPALALAMLALVLRQPHFIWYPLLLAGMIGTFLPLLLFPRIRRAYEERELRKMKSLDAV